MLFPSAHIIAFVLARAPEHGQSARGHPPVTLGRRTFPGRHAHAFRRFRFTRERSNDASMSADGSRQQDRRCLQSVFASDCLSVVLPVSRFILFSSAKAKISGLRHDQNVFFSVCFCFAQVFQCLTSVWIPAGGSKNEFMSHFTLCRLSVFFS